MTAIDADKLTLESFRDQPVAVLGLARSGVALARFLADRGARVTVYDARSTAELASEIDKLGARNVRLLLGSGVDPESALADQAMVFTSPSISSRYPTTEPRLRAALATLESAGVVPVVSEIDLFLRLCPGMTVGVTGTKGKTTTSSLSAAVLGEGQAPALLGGNIGVPLVERLPELTRDHRVVLELSELQLPTLSRGTDVAVFTHVTSDHLDRHGTQEAYVAVKRRLAELLPENGRLVLNAEDPVSDRFDDATSAPAVRYGRGDPPPGGVGVVDGWVVADGVDTLYALGGGEAMAGDGLPSPAVGRLRPKSAGSGVPPDPVRRFYGRVLPLDEVRLRGAHNTSNVLAAVAVGLIFGIVPEAIRRGVTQFRGVEHRLEPVGTIDGIEFVNDSMGTQPDAVIAALRSFEPPVVLIAGGRTKNVPLDELAGEVGRRAAAVVLIGETADEMEALFRDAGVRQIERADGMDDAVARAHAIAATLREVGDVTVLLSPAATSFDMFVDYAARGAAFKNAVRDLVERRAPVAGGAR